MPVDGPSASPQAVVRITAADEPQAVIADHPPGTTFVFAAGVHRDEVHAGAAVLDLPLDEHIANVIAALQPIAPQLGLPAAGAATA